MVTRGRPEALMEAVMEAVGGCLHHTGQAHLVLRHFLCSCRCLKIVDISDLYISKKEAVFFISYKKNSEGRLYSCAL
jgi:hypothetical protein